MFSLNIYMCTKCVYGAYGSIGYPGNGVMGCCEPPCWCRDLNVGPLQEQLVLLTADSCLQL